MPNTKLTTAQLDAINARSDEFLEIRKQLSMGSDPFSLSSQLGAFLTECKLNEEGVYETHPVRADAVRVFATLVAITRSGKGSELKSQIDKLFGTGEKNLGLADELGIRKMLEERVRQIEKANEETASRVRARR